MGERVLHVPHAERGVGQCSDPTPPVAHHSHATMLVPASKCSVSLSFPNTCCLDRAGLSCLRSVAACDPGICEDLRPLAVHPAELHRCLWWGTCGAESSPEVFCAGFHLGLQMSHTCPPPRPGLRHQGRPKARRCLSIIGTETGPCLVPEPGLTGHLRRDKGSFQSPVKCFALETLVRRSGCITLFWRLLTAANVPTSYRSGLGPSLAWPGPGSIGSQSSSRCLCPFLWTLPTFP